MTSDWWALVAFVVLVVGWLWLTWPLVRIMRNRRREGAHSGSRDGSDV